MKLSPPWLRLAFVALTALALAEPMHSAELLSYNRDIRPILAENCFACHGPDRNQRKANLRLDNDSDAYADRDGTRVIVPAKPQASELYRKLTASDPKKRMPPPKFGKQLSAAQMETLRQWIEQGGRWELHWSLIPPQRPPLPRVKNAAWPRNPIDHFVLSRLEREGLAPSPEADRRTLLRRLSFDLLGLPPSPKEVDAFVADKSGDAYEKVVERLLASEHFGERMALYWLDLVRFADTGGYHSDNHRDVTPYRDYVIRAFNQNKPFDQFTIEQLAGDLLPERTAEQRIASAYNRLLMTTEEGGAQPKEYAAKYAADRVRNASTVWLGITLGCTECHDHKYDPFKSRDFYRFAAFFADVQELAVGRQPQVPVPDDRRERELKELDERIVGLKKLADVSLPTLPVAEQETNARHFRGLRPAVVEARTQLAAAEKRKEELTRAAPTMLIAMAGPPRTMRLLPRGNWLDDSGAIVGPGVPDVLPQLAGAERRPTRLDLAHWLVGPEQPLTARVFVNRHWKLMFGQGIVKTLDDFGTQGGWPTHPELLDWLAIEFVDSGWDVKHLLRLMVESKTYRQTSKASEALRQRDPYNQLLARQGRFRLDAEMVRDNALAVSGLLVRKVGGRSVKPYQPPGYWQYLNFPKREYVKDQGEDQYRRGLYTYWQRTFIHPSLLAFDAPGREECTVERPRSNTPLQALVLLNDPTYVEASRVLAERIASEGGKETAAKIQFAFRETLGRTAQPEEVKTLSELFQRHLRDYQADTEAALSLLKTGDRSPAKVLTPPELAAWTSVARVILNLHETITRE